MINWLRPPTNLLMCAKSSQDDGLELKHFTQAEIDSQGITASLFMTDIQSHINEIDKHITNESEDFLLYCNLYFDGSFKYAISASDVKTTNDFAQFLKKRDDISKIIDDRLKNKLPFKFSFDFMDYDYDDTPYRYIYEYVVIP
jgi:hypothetical protein